MKTLLKKSVLFVWLVALVFVQLIPLYPQKTHAASAQDLSNKTENILKLEAFKRCVEDWLEYRFPRGQSPFINAGDAKKRVGHLVDSDDGKWQCKLPNQSRENAFFSLLYEPPEFKDKFTGLHSGDNAFSLPRNGFLSDCQGDDNPGLRFRIDYGNTSQSNDCENFASNNREARNLLGPFIQINIASRINDHSEDEKKAMRYLNMFEALKTGCDAEGPLTNANAISGDTVRIGDEIWKVNDDNALISVGYGAFGTDDGDLSCVNIASNLENNKAAYQRVTGETTTTPSTSPGANADGEATGGEDAPSCEEELSLVTGWVICPFLEFLGDAADKLLSYADSLLDVDGQALYDNSQLREVWSYFRVIASFALLGIGLVMVISQAIGGRG